MKYMKTLTTISALSLTLGISSGYAMDKGPKREKHSDHRVAAKAERGPHFHDDEVRIIRDYYREHNYSGGKQKELPRGLQKKYARTGELPPGWEKKLQRGEVLPVEVYRYGRPLPYELRQRLPIGPVGSKILEVEGKIIRVMENTREIIDILEL